MKKKDQDNKTANACKAHQLVRLGANVKRNDYSNLNRQFAYMDDDLISAHYVTPTAADAIHDEMISNPQYIISGLEVSQSVVNDPTSVQVVRGYAVEYIVIFHFRKRLERNSKVSVELKTFDVKRSGIIEMAPAVYTIYHEAEVRAILENRFYYPTKSNFTAFDFFYLDRDTLYCFQVSITAETDKVKLTYAKFKKHISNHIPTIVSKIVIVFIMPYSSLSKQNLPSEVDSNVTFNYLPFGDLAAEFNDSVLKSFN
jgi:hypothetical protein